MENTAPSGAARDPRMVGKRPTIRDVARVAGVSRGTVSRYLNGGKWVGEESSQAITAAIADTGYRANRLARSLATGQAATVAFLLTEPQDRLFGDPNYPILLRSVTVALGERGLMCVVLTAHTAEERSMAIEFATGGHIDGVLLVSSRAGEPMLEQLSMHEVPTVCCGRPMGHESSIRSVAADDRGGGRSAVEHLISLGRTRIGIITGPLDAGGARDRLDGYRDALDEHGLPWDESLIATGDWGSASGRVATKELLTRAPDLDGLFVSNDSMAAGAIASLRASGLDIPTDVPVIGFDDTGLAATVDPPLSSMRQPFAAIGREMVRLLCDDVAGDIAATVRVPTQLVVRASTCATP